MPTAKEQDNKNAGFCCAFAVGLFLVPFSFLLGLIQWEWTGGAIGFCVSLAVVLTIRFGVPAILRKAEI